MTPRKEEKKWNGKGANRKIIGETEEQALPSSSFSSLLPDKINSYLSASLTTCFQKIKKKQNYDVLSAQ